jgi:hypothetical protein
MIIDHARGLTKGIEAGPQNLKPRCFSPFDNATDFADCVGIPACVRKPFCCGLASKNFHKKSEGSSRASISR